MWLHCIQKGNSSNIHNVIKFLTVRLSGVNTATQSVCTLCFCKKKKIQNVVDFDACKQLFMLNSYTSAIKTIRSKKNHKSMIFLSNLNHDLNQTTLIKGEYTLINL